jgi:predicted dehydrogenase
MQLKKIIDDDILGKVVSINHTEAVGNVHQSHSFVRGNWGNSGRASFMLLQKCCHDIDILQWLLNQRCTRVQSFGSLSYFKAENKPEGAPEFCVQGCPVEDTCPYHAGRIYHVLKKYVTHATGKHHPTKEDVDYAISNTNYGRCVFQLDNDAVDHQVVNLEYEDGATVSFTMSGFNKGGRKIRIMGTKGEIYGDMSQKTVSLYSFDTLETEEIPIVNAVTDETIFGGHGGGDLGIIKAFCQFMTGKYEGNSITDITTSVENHLVTFAAEDARLSGSVVTMKDYIASL